MALETGAKLGPYEIVAPAGAGGMGEVYRARDTRLERTVAIKVLPADLTQHSDMRARLEREARAISALNHPNICTLYDIGHQDGMDYLVMEYLEGETLEKRLERGALPTQQTLAIAKQVADALERAHREGIVHRDLKPSNIMLTKTGAKLLDFGLAKPQAAMAANAALTAMTTGKPLTTQGMIVGTYQYMAPEQLEGKEADARSDIFSFGAVLYEMTTGRRAFDGKTQASVIASILASEPTPMSQVAPMSPPALDRLVRTCLAKDPDERWQTVHDIRLQLEMIEELGSQAGVPRTVAAVRKHRRKIGTGVMAVGWALAVLAAVAAWIYARRWEGEQQQVMRAELNQPAGWEWSDYPGHFALSHNGRQMAFIANDGKKDMLWVRDLESGKQQALAGTDSAMYPFWSPDGSHVGFFQNGKLRTIAANGGPIEVVCDAADGRGGSWSQKGWIIFTPTISDAIYKVPDGGGTPVAITKKPGPAGTSRNPEFLPDGKHFLFTYHETDTNAHVGSVYAGSLDGMEQKMVLKEGSNTAYYDGHLLYFKDGNLVTQEFDTGSLKVSGNPVALAQGIEYWKPRDMANFAVANTGLLIYRLEPSQRVKLGWTDESGRDLGDASDGIDDLTGYVLSPDGKMVALSRWTPDHQSMDVWLLDVERKTMSRVTLNGSGGAASFAFSPDSASAVFAYTYGGAPSAVLRSLRGSGEEKLPMAENETVSSWSPDGRYLVLTVQKPDTKLDVYAQDLKGDRKPFPVVNTAADEGDGVLSPNGKWMAYDSNESGRQEVYVTAFPGPGGKWQVSTNGGAFPQWSADGKELYYVTSKLMKVDVSDPATMQLGSTHELITLYIGSGPIQPFQLAPDGKRILVMKAAGGAQQEPVHVVTHWVQLLGKQ